MIYGAKIISLRHVERTIIILMAYPWIARIINNNFSQPAHTWTQAQKCQEQGTIFLHQSLIDYRLYNTRSRQPAYFYFYVW